MKPSLLLSIVVPVYNVSQYVEKCIRSCYNQKVDPSFYEIIVVNDGSKDDSLEICEKLQIEFKGLQIISQENKGLSGARNTGLAHAKGDYVWFVDSDDWIEENCLKALFENFKLFDADIFWIGHTIVSDDGILENIPKQVPIPITGQELFIEQITHFYIWKFIYRTDFLVNNNLEFFEGLLYEDLEFTPRALLKAKNCYTLPNSYYNYLIRSGSIANIGNIKIKGIHDRLLIIKNLNNLKTDRNASSQYKIKLQNVMVEEFIDTIKMCSRAGLGLPKSAHSLLKILEQDSNILTSNKFIFSILKLNLGLYYSFYKAAYAFYKKIKV